MEDRIICPYCEKLGDNNEIDYEDHPGIDSIGNGGTVEFECPYCEKKFMVTLIFYWSVDKFCQLNGEEHDFELRLENSDTLFCKNCEEVKLSERQIKEIRDNRA